MTDPHAINLEESNLQPLSQICETGEVLPAHQVLKEDIEGRFQVLASMGITNLADLIAALKTEPRIEAFARESGLPRQYPIVLGREARSYAPKLLYLRDIPGVDREQVEGLAAVGIKNSKHLQAGTP
jgi:hypothetical protein